MTDELPSWLTRAACRGATVTFFPERGESVDDARAICSTCPVRAECTAAALVANEGYGVWG